MSSNLAGRSILIVEDEPIIAMELTQAFQDEGADVTTTTKLKQAIILVEHDGLAAAILDHVLGDGDSNYLCERLIERNVPFVIYSGLDKVEGACAQGPLVQKPASAAALIAIVRRVIAAQVA